MNSAMHEALANLKTARQEQALRVAEEQTRLAQLDQMIAHLQQDVVVIDPALIPKRKDYADLGIVEATHRLLAEIGRGLTTPELAQELLNRGMTTRSKRFVPTVYATLTNSKEFIRKGEGRDAVWLPKKAR